MTLTKVRDALEPFAFAAEVEEEVGRDDPEENRVWIIQAYGCQLAEITIGDLCRAREALASLDALLKGEGDDAELIAALLEDADYIDSYPNFVGSQARIINTQKQAADRIAVLTEQVKEIRTQQKEDFARADRATTLIGKAQQVHARILQEGCLNPKAWGDDLIANQQELAAFVRSRALTDDGGTP